MLYMHKKRDWFIFLGLVSIIAIFKLLPSLVEPLDNDSGAVAYEARLITRGEPLYSITHHPVHHLPAIFYTNALGFKLLGDNPNTPKLILFPFTLACAWILFTAGRALINPRTGLLAAIFFILVSSEVVIKGTTAETEHFANLPLTAGTFFAIFLLRKNAPAWHFISIGVLSAICLLYKAIYIAPLAVAGFSILVSAWLESSWKTAFARLTWMAIGLILPLATVAFYFAHLGLWERILLVFKLGSNYVNTNAMYDWLPAPFGFPIFWMGVTNATLLILGLAGIYHFWGRIFPLRTRDNITSLAIALWFFVSLMEAGLRGGGWENYALLAIPSFAFMGAYEIEETYRRLQTRLSENRARLEAGFLVFLVAANFAFANFQFYNHYLLYKLGAITFDNFILGYEGTTGTGANALNAKKIGEYIAARTDPNDFIYSASFNVQIYYYANRLAPVDMIWPDRLSYSISPERVFDPSTIYIILDPPSKIIYPEEFIELLTRYYHLEKVIGEMSIYRRNSP